MKRFIKEITSILVMEFKLPDFVYELRFRLRKLKFWLRDKAKSLKSRLIKKLESFKKKLRRKRQRITFRKLQIKNKIKKFFSTDINKETGEITKHGGAVGVSLLKFSALYGFIINFPLHFIFHLEFTIFTMLGYGFIWHMFFNEFTAFLRKCRSR
jgi:hypothetical protein